MSGATIDVETQQGLSKSDRFYQDLANTSESIDILTNAVLTDIATIEKAIGGKEINLFDEKISIAEIKGTGIEEDIKDKLKSALIQVQLGKTIEFLGNDTDNIDDRITNFIKGNELQNHLQKYVSKITIPDNLKSIIKKSEINNILPDKVDVKDEMLTDIKKLKQELQNATDIDGLNRIVNDNITVIKNNAKDFKKFIDNSINKEISSNFNFDSFVGIVDSIVDSIPDLEGVVNVLTPILTITVIGIPLALLLTTMSVGFKTLRNNKILVSISNKLSSFIMYAYLMHTNIERQLKIFINYENNANHPLKKLSNYENVINSFKKQTINPILIKNIHTSITELCSNLRQVMVIKGTGNMFSKMSRSLRRMTAPEKWTNYLVRDTTILNSFLIVYKNQFDTIKSNYERILVRSVPPTEDIHPYYEIWDIIESTNEYKREILNNGNDTEVIQNEIMNEIANLKTKKAAEYNTFENIVKTTDPTNKLKVDDSKIGGRRTKRKKERKK
tara:strand:+ start:3886 stop:5391 length:1506 start_codon:yes stop_codon:yes gene_type:complete